MYTRQMYIKKTAYIIIHHVRSSVSGLVFFSVSQIWQRLSIFYRIIWNKIGPRKVPVTYLTSTIKVGYLNFVSIKSNLFRYRSKFIPSSFEKVSQYRCLFRTVHDIDLLNVNSPWPTWMFTYVQLPVDAHCKCFQCCFLFHFKVTCTESLVEPLFWAYFQCTYRYKWDRAQILN